MDNSAVAAGPAYLAYIAESETQFRIVSHADRHAYIHMYVCTYEASDLNITHERYALLCLTAVQQPYKMTASLYNHADTDVADHLLRTPL